MKTWTAFLAILFGTICAPAHADAPEGLLVGKWVFDSIRHGNASQPAPRWMMLMVMGENSFKQFSKDHLFVSQEKGRREYGNWTLSDNNKKLTISINGGDIYIYGISTLTSDRMNISMMNGGIHAEMVKTTDAPDSYLTNAIPDAATAQATVPQLTKNWGMTDVLPPSRRAWLKSLKQTPFMHLKADGHYQTQYDAGLWFLEDDGRSIVLWEHEGTEGKRWYIRAISANELIIQRPNTTDVKNVFSPRQLVVAPPPLAERVWPEPPPAERMLPEPPPPETAPNKLQR